MSTRIQSGPFNQGVRLSLLSFLTFLFISTLIFLPATAWAGETAPGSPTAHGLIGVQDDPDNLPDEPEAPRPDPVLVPEFEPVSDTMPVEDLAGELLAAGLIEPRIKNLIPVLLTVIPIDDDNIPEVQLEPIPKITREKTKPIEWLIKPKRIYLGRPTNFKRPAVLLMRKVFEKIEAWQIIVRSNIPNYESRYYLLLDKANRIFDRVLRQLAVEYKIDLIGEIGAVSCSDGRPIADVTERALEILDNVPARNSTSG